MYQSLTGPFEVSLKENGCIIFIASIEGHLLVTSKHSFGSVRQDGLVSHSEKGREWLMRHLARVGKRVEELVDFLQLHQVTAVCEVC